MNSRPGKSTIAPMMTARRSLGLIVRHFIGAVLGTAARHARGDGEVLLRASLLLQLAPHRRRRFYLHESARLRQRVEHARRMIGQAVDDE